MMEYKLFYIYKTTMKKNDGLTAKQRYYLKNKDEFKMRVYRRRFKEKMMKVINEYEERKTGYFQYRSSLGHNITIHYFDDDGDLVKEYDKTFLKLYEYT